MAIASYYYERIFKGKNSGEKRHFAYEWARYEEAMLCLKPKQNGLIDKELGEYPLEQWVRIEVHYMKHGCFLPNGYILENSHRIAHIPTSIVQGRYDMCCPPISAFCLHNALKQSELNMVFAGHSSTDPEIRKKLVLKTEAMHEKIG